jgi:aspartate aminotransferase
VVASYQKDTNKNKINLGIGAYQDNDGRPYVFKSVLEAEDKIR